MPTERKSSRTTRQQPRGEARRRAATSKRGRRRPRMYKEQWSTSPMQELDEATRRRSELERLSDAPDDLILRAALKKFPWIGRFVREGCPRGKLVEYARLYAKLEGLPEDQVPPYTTLNTWVKRYLLEGMPGLVDATNRFAGQSRVVTGDALRHLEAAAAMGMGTTRILNYLTRVLPEDVDVPSQSSIGRALRAFERREPLLVAMARMGPTWFRENFELALTHGLLPGGMRFSIDSTVIDLWVRVWVAGAWKPMRPVLTVLQDVGSRALITFNLSLYPVDSGICVALLGRAFDPARNYPGLPTTYPPHQFTLDKGAEHQGRFLERLKTLGVEIVPRRDNDPRGGAHIERLIGTITTEVFMHQIGYSRCERIFDPYAPADRDMKRSLSQLKYDPFRLEVPVEVLPRLNDLEADLLAWATIYNERPHSALAVDAPETQAVLRSVRRIVARQPLDGLEQEAA